MTTGSPFGDQLTVSAVVVFILQMLKKASWFPWLTVEKDRLNRSIAVALAGLSALGINITFQSTEGVLTITGLTAGTFLHGGWEWLKAFAVQEFVYRSTKPAKNGGTEQITKGEPIEYNGPELTKT